MTISSSLNASVAGLSVNATRLAAISDNIANSATNGYKRVDVDFSNLVLQQRQNAYAAGGVRVRVFRDVEAEGTLVGTGSSTDVSVAGRGMLPVTTEAGTTQLAANRALLFTPTGSFTADQNGFLRTEGGSFLLGFPANSAGEIVNAARDSGSSLVPVNIAVNQFTAAPTTEISLGVNLPASATSAGEDPRTFDLPTEYFDNIGRSQTLTMSFSPTIPTIGSSNTWTVSVTDTASDDPTAAIATFEVTFSDDASTGGTIESVNVTGTAASGDTLGASNLNDTLSYDATTGNLSLNVGSVLRDGTVEGSPINIFIGQINDTAGLSQLSAPFSPYAVNKDGAPIGDLAAVEIDSSGFLQAIYDTGFRRTLFQIPVADVPNFNGLIPLDNQTFALSQESGDVYFYDSGTGPVGTTEGFSLMESTTDVASELTDLIETQRAYSSNATVVQTVDEMLQETSSLGR